MLDSIYIGISGLKGFSQGLRVIANNTGNLNTPGFKSSSLGFANLFESGSQPGAGGRGGGGVMAGTTSLNFSQGELRQTGNGLDLAVDGQGMFMLKDQNGKYHYTRAGEFQFNGDGTLVNRSDGAKVMGIDADGALTEISMGDLRFSTATATTRLMMSGNLTTTVSPQTIGGLHVVDSAGGEHTLSATFTSTGSGTWSVTLKDGTTAVGAGSITFVNGKIDPAHATLTLSYTPAGMAAMPLTLDFSNNVTSFAAGNLSTLGLVSQDGVAPGELTDASFDATGMLVLTYSNAQTVKGPKLALSRFDSIDAIEAIGNNAFDATKAEAWHIGTAGQGAFGAIKSGMIEISNVDLSQEFSNLVIMQRGYQASSQIISTANEMLQELFAMKSK